MYGTRRYIKNCQNSIEKRIPAFWHGIVVVTVAGVVDGSVSSAGVVAADVVGGVV